MKVLLIDDHVLFRDGMRMVLERLGEHVHVFNASSYEYAIPVMKKNLDMDLILLDLGLPGLNDIDALKAVRRKK